MEKKVYTKEFKVGAARMVVEEQKKASHVARDLGVSTSALSKWIRDYKKNGSGAFPGKGMLVPVDQERRDLEKRLRRAEMERDLLKKTIAIFAGLDRKNITP
jgi:transposase